MSARETAIRAVRDAESSAADVTGNMESALHLIQRPERLSDAVQALEWAAENLRSARFRIEEALSSARTLTIVSDAPGQEGGSA